MLGCYYYYYLCLLNFFFNFLLGKCGFSFDPWPQRGTQIIFWVLRRRLRSLHLVPNRADFSRRPSNVVKRRQAPGCAQLPDTACPPRPIICLLGRWTPSIYRSRVYHSHAPLGGAPPPLPRTLPVVLNNDICMQGTIHKYVRAGEI